MKTTLTGKAKVDFWKWYSLPETLKWKKQWQNVNIKDYFIDMPDVCRQAIIIEWLDSIDIYISIIPVIYKNEKLNCFQVEINNKIISHKTKQSRNFENRTQASLRAIEIANELYNENFLWNYKAQI